MAQGLLLWAFEGKVLSEESFQSMIKRLTRARDNLMEEVLARDILQKSFYTILYEPAPGQCKTLTKARREWILRKKTQLAAQGKLISPVYAKTYWYNNQQTLDDIKALHGRNVAHALDAAYFERVRAIAACPGPFEPGAFAAGSVRLSQQYGDHAARMLAQYARLWHSLV